MGLLNDVYPIFFYLKLRKSATGRAFDGVVTPSGTGAYKISISRLSLWEF
jgi:hypothetical protein